jgi:ABC-type Zn2+ transport system substrate-binding protein/surface adhesin
MAYGKLSTQELEGAIEQTREAIRRGQEMLEIGSGEPVTKGLEKLADSMPSLIEKLRDDLKKLEKAQGKGAEDNAEDDEDDEEEDDDDEDKDKDDEDEDDEDEEDEDEDDDDKEKD